MRKNFGKISTLGLLVILIFSLALSVVILRNNSQHRASGDFLTGGVGGLLGAVVSAQEIYPMFLCPCCSQPLDKKNICCGMAQERINYIDSLVKEKNSKDKIILNYVQKYGSNSFADKNFAQKFKEQLAAQAPKERPIIYLQPESQDLGNISQKQGTAAAIFTLKNEGKKDLVIDKLDTSCGCTSASIVYKGLEGPRFAMAGHGFQNPTNWSITIPAGETAQLKVYYDPNIHKDLRGWVVREIYIYSNDPVDFEKKVQIELTQVD